MVPVRGIGGWLYAQIRPNLGTLSGGGFVWAPGGAAPWEQPYYAYQFFEPLPEALDLTNVTFRNGLSVKCLEPGMVYDLGYKFRDSGEFVADLRFEGVTPPVPHLRGAPPFVGGSSHSTSMVASRAQSRCWAKRFPWIAFPSVILPTPQADSDTDCCRGVIAPVWSACVTSVGVNSNGVTSTIVPASLGMPESSSMMSQRMRTFTFASA